MIHQLAICYRDERTLACEEPKCRRRVRFNASDNIHAASPFLLPETREERNHLWYQKKDFKHFIEQGKELAAGYRLAKKRQQDLSHLHVRGLENQLSIESNIGARLRVASVTKLVLKEQARQRMNGVVYPSILRARSLSVTRRAQHVAYKLAKQDAMDAAAVADDEEPLQTDDTSNGFAKDPRTSAAVAIDREDRMIMLDHIPQPLLA